MDAPVIVTAETGQTATITMAASLLELEGRIRAAIPAARGVAVDPRFARYRPDGPWSLSWELHVWVPSWGGERQIDQYGDTDFNVSLAALVAAAAAAAQVAMVVCPTCGRPHLEATAHPSPETTLERDLRVA